MNELITRYQPIIDKLAQIYDEHEIIIKFDDNPIKLLREYIETVMTIMAQDSSPNYDLAIRLYIKELNCFKWRFINAKNAGDVWNPLYESYASFSRRADNNITHWFASTPFPSEEIIENWIKSHVKSVKKSSKKSNDKRTSTE